MSRFHPDLTLAGFLPRAAIGPRTVELGRRAAALQPGVRGVEVIEVAPGLSARLHRPPADRPGPVPGVLYLHGGGYVIGTAKLGDRFCAPLARHLGVLVVAVDYRLAPEHPYPAALEDAHAALGWLAAQPGVDADRLALVGDSAGAGLAAALALKVRDLGQLRPAVQVLTYPMLDDRTTDGGIDERSVRLWSAASNRFGWAAYLGALGGDDVPGTAAPARAEDLAGLPSTWIGVGTNDLFHAEDVAWARRLAAAGVPCELLEVEGAYHGFDVVEPHAEVSRAFRRARIDALRAALTRPA